MHDYAHQLPASSQLVTDMAKSIGYGGLGERRDLICVSKGVNRLLVVES